MKINVLKIRLNIFIITEFTFTMESKKRYNEEIIVLMEKVSDIMSKRGEPFRAKAYQKARDTLLLHNTDITGLEMLNGLPGFGPTIIEKCKEYMETGTLKLIEQEKTNPINILTDVYGIGPKKAEELVKSGINTIAELRARKDELLNDVQKIGLQYYEDILQRIPRSEIQEYDALFYRLFSTSASASASAKFEIVGSYRRGALHSGDIDVIITGSSGQVYCDFVDELIKRKIITHILSRGQSKTLVIAKLPGDNRVSRRIDFLYSSPEEFPFAILYFTGSKIFNTIMRQKALDQGYTFNEHGIYHLSQNKKGEKVQGKPFQTEKDIFDFLGLQYKTPVERADGRALTASVKDTVPTAGASVKDTVPTAAAPLVAQFVKSGGTKFLNTLSESELTSMLQFASKQYYNYNPDSEPLLMTDNQYDILKDFVQERFPSNQAAKEVGAEVERNKVKLPYLMASMDKIKPDTGSLTVWKQKFKGPYVLSCKLDGVSGLYTTEGKEPKLYTRGNGVIGQDISHLIPYLRLPTTRNVVIRGEFIISKATFAEKYQKKFANPRNMVAGIINQKTVTEAVNDLDFVAYEVIKPKLKPSEQMDFAGKLDVALVLHFVTGALANEMLSNILVDWRTSYMYEIDGVIVTEDKIYERKQSGNPEHAFAFKMVLSDQIAEAIVTDVIWTPSKDGYLKPRVQIEPLQLGGVKIEYATGFNAAFIQDNKIGIGATIQLIRSGDVIPHIRSITVPAPAPKMPDIPFKWNATHIDIMLEDLLGDPTVKEKNITGFFKGIGVDGLSSGNVARIIDAGYDTVAKIISMQESDYLKVDGFKEKMANKIYTGIQQKLEEAQLVTLMSASNIFGRGFSDKKIELILQELPDILVTKKYKTTVEKVAAIAAIKGMASKTAEAFVARIEEFKQFMAEAGLAGKLDIQQQQKPDNQTNHPLFGKTVVLTGTREKTIIEFLKAVGAVQGGAVSKNTHLVVAKTKNDDTGKAEEARKLNIPLQSVDEFIQMYMTK